MPRFAWTVFAITFAVVFFWGVVFWGEAGPIGSFLFGGVDALLVWNFPKFLDYDGWLDILFWEWDDDDR